MREVQGTGEGHCLHRGPHRHREDSQSPEGQGSQPNSPIHPTAAATGTPLVSRVGAGTGGLNILQASHQTSRTMRPTGIAGGCVDSGGGDWDCRWQGGRIQHKQEAIQGFFRVSRGFWRRDRTRDEQRLQARRQWHTCLYSLPLVAEVSAPTASAPPETEIISLFVPYGYRQLQDVNYSP